MTQGARPVLFLSNGTAEDLIGARLAKRLAVPVRYAPLVGEGRAYGAVPGARRVGRVLRLPSGGFPFGSLDNLRADLRAGLIGESLGQWADAVRGARDAGAVVVVGDAYALMVGTLAARRAGAALIHVQPLLSAHYLDGLGLRGALRELNALGANLPMPYELRLARGADAVFVRDAATEEYYRRRGVAARFAGSFAMDVLPAPERELQLLEGRPVLALLPGSRGDHRESLPVMLRVAALLPDVTALVAWSHPWEAVTLPDGWTLFVHDETEARAVGEGVSVPLLRGAFGAVARAADVALGTAGTANEQLAGLGVPVVAFATGGPQYTAGFARRQGRLLGEALRVIPTSGESQTNLGRARGRKYRLAAVDEQPVGFPDVRESGPDGMRSADPRVLAREIRALLRDGAARARAARAGLSRVGPAGALPVIAAEIRQLSQTPKNTRR